MITYRTTVLYIKPSPLGLVGDRWHVEHHCDTCRQAIPTDQLVDHAKTHEHRPAPPPTAPILDRPPPQPSRSPAPAPKEVTPTPT